MNTVQIEFLSPFFLVQPHTLHSHCEGYIVDGYEAGIYVVDNYKWSIILGITLTLCINRGIMFVEVDDVTWLMPEATCSIERPTPYASVLEATEMCPRRLRWVRRSILMSHVRSVSPLSLSHSLDCHERCTISHFTSPPSVVSNQ